MLLSLIRSIFLSKILFSSKLPMELSYILLIFTKNEEKAWWTN